MMTRRLKEVNYSARIELHLDPHVNVVKVPSSVGTLEWNGDDDDDICIGSCNKQIVLRRQFGPAQSL